MAVSPPFNIAETSPALTDLISQYPPVENLYRDTVESWLTLVSDPATGELRALSTDSGATAGPAFRLYRDSPSPAAADLIGQIIFQGEDSAGNTENYVTITGQIGSPTSGAEIGNLVIDLLGTGGITVSATDATAAAGPNLLLYRVSASPAVNDILGQVIFQGRDSASNLQTYAYISGLIRDPTSTTESGFLNISTVQAGVATTSLRIDGATMAIGGASTSTGIIYRDQINNGSLHIYGGNNFGVGAHIELYGGAHAAVANQAFYDASAHTFRTQSGVERGEITTAGDYVSHGSSGFSADAGVFARSAAGTIFIRPNGISSGVAQGTYDSAGNFVAAGNVTAFSDDRLKTDWTPLDQSFLDGLAEIKSGTYTRKDLGTRQAGVSAQDLQKLLPQLVHESDDGTLSVAYGNAALVAAVELANEVRSLRYRVAELEGK